MSTLLTELDKLRKSHRRLTAETRDLESQRKTVRASLKSDLRAHTYYSLLARLRSPKASFDLWPIGAIIVGGVFVGLTALLFLALAGFSSALVTLGTILGACIGSGIIGRMMFHPTDSLLTIRTNEALERVSRSRVMDDQLHSRLENAISEILEIEHSKKSILSSVRYQREQLLNMNWKAMRDTEWEKFLESVFLALGMEVEITKKVGDQGVDLVVSNRRRRIAIQAKGYHHSVNNSAVQQAVAGKSHYNCNACAVITNSRFTKSAQELAVSNDCILISENEIPALILGEFSI